MKVMIRVLNLKRPAIVTVALFAILFSGCSRINDKPAADYLDLALAGMAGSDGVTFEGAAALLRGSDGTPYESLYYGGTMEEHHKVTLYSLVQDASNSTAASGKSKKTRALSPAKPYYYSQLEKIEGQWRTLTQSSTEENHALPLLNPFQQLEDLEDLDKTVTEETGAGRGNRFLRIELTPEEARNQLVKELNGELSSLRSNNYPAEGRQGLGNPEMVGALEDFWKKQDSELQRKLDAVQVKTVYHLIVDSRRNLPRRLACTRTVSFSGSTDKQIERFVSQIDFYGYR